MKTKEEIKKYYQDYYVKHRDRLRLEHCLWHKKNRGSAVSANIRWAMKQIPKDTYTLSDHEKSQRNDIVRELRLQSDEFPEVIPTIITLINQA